MAGARISKSAGPSTVGKGGPLGDPFDRYVQLPLIFIAFLRADGWPIAAYSHNTEPETWCVKVRKDAIVTVGPDGALAFKGLSPGDQRLMMAVQDQACTAYRGLLESRQGARV